MSELRLKNYQQLTLETLRDYFKACVRLDDVKKIPVSCGEIS